MILHVLWLAATALVRSPRRTVLTAGALANAVAGGLLFYGFTRNTYWGLAEVFARGGNGHVQVADADWFDAPAPEEHRSPVATLERARQAIEADPTLAPLLLRTGIRRQITGMLTDGERSGVFLGVGTQPEVEADLAPLALPVQGRALAEVEHEATVLLGETLAARLAVQPGDIVTAMVTTDSGMTNAMDLEVAGFARTGSLELDATLATLPLSTALSLTDADHADLLVLALHDTEDTDAALAATRRALEGQGLAELAARPWKDRAAYYQAVRALYDRIFGIFEALMVLVVVLSLTQAVAAVVTERRQEIALLRVVGLKRRQVVGCFVAEGALLGLLGAGLGLLGAWGVAWVVRQFGGIPMPPPPGYTVGYAAQFSFDALGYAIVLPATVLAAMVASAIPAARAARGALSRALAGLCLLIAAGVVARPAVAGDLAAAQALLAGSDAQRAVAADELCQVDVRIEERDNTVAWRLLLHHDHTLAVTTSLEPGKRQAVLREGDATWYQTEAMRRPLRVSPSQRVQGQVALAELLAPRLEASWAPTSLVQGEQRTVHATAIQGGPAAHARAELDFDSEGRLVDGRFFGASGKLVRTAHWSWDGDALQGVELRNPVRPEQRTTIRTQAPRCAPGAWSTTEDSLLEHAVALAESG